MYNVNNIEEFKEKIYNVYGNSLKKLYIESENNTIHFPNILMLIKILEKEISINVNIETI